MTHHPPAHVRLPHHFTFVDGVAAAVDQARAAAGDHDVVVMGGADVVRQCLDDALVDELRLHIAPLILGGGTPLFGAAHRRLTQLWARSSSTATHVAYRVERDG